MKKILIIFIIALTLISCSETFPSKGEFVVKLVDNYDGLTYKYWITSVHMVQAIMYTWN